MVFIYKQHLACAKVEKAKLAKNKFLIRSRSLSLYETHLSFCAVLTCFKPILHLLPEDASVSQEALYLSLSAPAILCRLLLTVGTTPQMVLTVRQPCSNQTFQHEHEKLTDGI